MLPILYPLSSILHPLSSFLRLDMGSQYSPVLRRAQIPELVDLANSSRLNSNSSEI